MYFVHSYFVDPNDASTILTKTTYADITYASSILKNNIFACQFHPEKSATEGLKIYKNWATLNKLI
jgi:glutamine amidotransferase